MVKLFHDYFSYQDKSPCTDQPIADRSGSDFGPSQTDATLTHLASQSGHSDSIQTETTTPKTLMLCMQKPRTNTVKFLLWSEPDELVDLKWCPVITPLLLLSFIR